MLYWSEIDNAKISQNMKLLTIDCNNGSKLFISLTPISSSHRQYLKVAIDGRVQAKVNLNKIEIIELNGNIAEKNFLSSKS